MPAAPAAIAAFDLVKSFGATKALQGASLEVNAGEVHALLGENGSGKSTFAKILAGIERSDQGRVERHGRSIDVSSPAIARELGIGIVLQELSLAPDLSVVENMFLGRERAHGPIGWISARDEAAICLDALNRLGIVLDPRLKVRTLGMAQKQILEIGKALLTEPEVLIFDEPTASLTEREIAQLFGLIGQLQKDGKAIIYVTHHLREVMEIADRVSVMRDGRIVATQEVTEDTTESDLITLLIGRIPSNAKPTAARATSECVLRVSEFSSRICRDVSFQVEAGEIVGLYGVVGCGREELTRTIVGLHRPREGDIVVAGTKFRPRDPCEALKRGVGFVASDRKHEGILPNRNIRENLMLSSLSALTRGGLLSLKKEAEICDSQLHKLRVRYSSADDLIVSLSGGNQQKVLLGRALSSTRYLLVLEDPTAGIDIGAKHDLYRQIRESTAEGISALWLSSDLVETLTLCDRVYAMYAGRIVDELVAPTMADEERLLAAVLGQFNEGARA